MKKKNSLLQMGCLMLAGSAIMIAASCTSGSSGSGGSSPPVPETTKDTTVLVYILGTDLENNGRGPESGAATANITEMMKVGSTANMNVVIQTGGANRPESQSLYGIKWQNAERWYVMRESLNLVADLGPDKNVDMGSESALQSFIQWGVQTYPAKKFILVLWDHGGGPNGGMGPNEITKSVISTPSILKAVSSANTKFEIVGFDECLMGSGEIAAGLIPSANYMVGSEDIEPGAGWDYTPFLAYVTAESGANGAQIGKAIVDSYAAKMNKANQVYTLSVTQLDKMQAVIDTTNALSNQLTPLATGSINGWESVAYARLYSLDYQTSAFFSGSSYDLVDMKQFLGNINKNFAGNQEIITASDAVADALTSAVVYESSNYSNLGSTGLTVYFPSIMNTFESKNYAKNTTSLVTDKPYFAAGYTESINGLVAKYYGFYATNQNNLIATIVPDSAKVTAESITAVVSNNFDTVLAAGGGIDGCDAFELDDNSKKTNFDTLLCYPAIMNNVTVTESDVNRNYNVAFMSMYAGNWPTLGGKSIALIPNQSNFKTYVPGDEPAEYMIPAALQYNEYPQYAKSGYLRVEVRSGMYTVVDFQPAGNPAPKSQVLEAGQKYYLGAYVSYQTVSGTVQWQWAYLNDSSFTVSKKYDPKTNPVTLSAGTISTPSKFTFIVAGITGQVNIGESVNYNY